MRVSQNSFTGGEWSPSMYGRTDLATFKSSVRKMLNMFPHMHGGASNRGGTEFISEDLYGATYTRLIPFQFNAAQVYVLAFSFQVVMGSANVNIRIFKDGTLVLDGLGDGTDLGGGTWNLSAHGTNEYYKNGVSPEDWVAENVDAGADPVTGDYMTEGTVGSLAAGQYGWGDNDGIGRNVLYVRLTSGVDPSTLAADELQTGDPVVLSLSVPSCSTADLVREICYKQSADTLFLAHRLISPTTITRQSHTAWTLSSIIFGPSLSAPTSLSASGGSGTARNYVITSVDAYGEESDPSSAVSGSPGCTITFTDAVDAAFYRVYKDGAGSGFYGFIGASAGGAYTEASGGITPDYSFTPPVDKAPFNSENPGCLTIFEQRLVLARLDSFPQSIFGSVVGSYYNMNASIPARDADAYEFEIASDQVNEIMWLLGMNTLLIGTKGGEFRMASAGNQGSITPLSVDIKQQSNWGSCYIQPIRAGNSAVFIDGSQKRVRELTYSLELDGFTGSDLTLLAGHLFDGKQILDWAYQRYPYSIFWIVLDDGTLAGLTYNREQQVYGWHRHETDGDVESIACIPGESGHDDVYLVVVRDSARCVERMVNRLPSDDVSDAFFVDSGLTYDGWNDSAVTMTLSGASWDAGDEVTMTASSSTFSAAMVGRYFKLKREVTTVVDGLRAITTYSVIVRISAYTSDTVVTVEIYNRPVPTQLQATATAVWASMATTFSGLDHLEGQYVSVLADGNVYRNKLVASGGFSLDEPAAKVTAGLPYTSELVTHDYEFATQQGTTEGDKKTVASLTLKVDKTRALWIGPDADHLNEVRMRTDEDYGDPIAMRSENLDLFVDPSSDGEASITIRNYDPVPLTVLSIHANIDSSDT